MNAVEPICATIHPAAASWSRETSGRTARRLPGVAARGASSCEDSTAAVPEQCGGLVAEPVRRRVARGRRRSATRATATSVQSSRPRRARTIVARRTGRRGLELDEQPGHGMHRSGRAVGCGCQLPASSTTESRHESDGSSVRDTIAMVVGSPTVSSATRARRARSIRRSSRCSARSAIAAERRGGKGRSGAGQAGLQVGAFGRVGHQARGLRGRRPRLPPGGRRGGGARRGRRGPGGGGGGRRRGRPAAAGRPRGRTPRRRRPRAPAGRPGSR